MNKKLIAATVALAGVFGAVALPKAAELVRTTVENNSSCDMDRVSDCAPKAERPEI